MSSVNRRVSREQDKRSFKSFCENWKRLKIYQDTQYSKIRAENREPTKEEYEQIGQLRGRRPTFNEWKTLNLKAIERSVQEDEQRQQLSAEQLEKLSQIETLDWDEQDVVDSNANATKE